MQPPPDAFLASATVASWKSEQIGFEVGGRVEWVVEPNIEIEGRVNDETGVTVAAGTPVARLEDERYRLQVDTAKANVMRAEQSIKAAEIELNKTIPSRIRAADAELKLARTNLDRSLALLQQNAVAQEEVDRDQANFENAAANLEQLNASSSAKEADVQSLHSQLLQAQQALRDAERDLEDCTLYSSFRGQIAEVSVVPGSVVTAGQPVATIQMMDPIKVEVEVSAADSRRLNNRERIPVMVSLVDGSVQEHDGYLYQVDSIADPATRTFTLTLLLLNQKQAGTQQTDDTSIAVAQQLWRLNFQFLPGTEEGKLFAAEDSILQDDLGSFVWRVDNAQAHEPLPADRLLKVSKLRVVLGPEKVPFLGNWLFRQVLINDPSFDPNLNLIVGKLVVPVENPDEWDGDTVLVGNDSQWLLRPGEVVRVDLSSSDAVIGYYVPMDAIVRVGHKSFLYCIAESDNKTSVVKTEIQIVEPTAATASSSMRRIAPVGESSLDNLRYVTRGAHYLRDGEAVKVVTSAETTR